MVARLNRYSLAQELSSYSLDSRIKRLNETEPVWGLCIAMTSDDPSKEGCVFFTSQQFNEVYVTSYKNLVHGTLLKEIPLMPVNGKYHIYLAVSSMNDMLMTYLIQNVDQKGGTLGEKKLSIYKEHVDAEYNGHLMPRELVYLLIE